MDCRISRARCTRALSNALARIETGTFHSAHNFGRTDAERSRKPNDCSESWTLHTAFNSAQLRPIDAELDVNLQLGESCLFSDLAEHNPEGLFRT